MFEKVNPAHPDKIADRIAGAIVDAAYRKEENPKIAVEVLIGHGMCHIITETSVHINRVEVTDIVRRIAGDVKLEYQEVPQDVHLSENQKEKFRCGYNGIFKGTPVTDEQKKLTGIAALIYQKYHSDGKYILFGGKLTICQSNARTDELKKLSESHHQSAGRLDGRHGCGFGCCKQKARIRYGRLRNRWRASR